MTDGDIAVRIVLAAALLAWIGSGIAGVVCLVLQITS